MTDPTPPADEAAIVARIGAWLRKDAGKTRDTLRHLHALKTLSFSQSEDWEALIAAKIGLADAFERGDWKDKDDA